MSNELPATYGTLTCRSKFKALNETDEKACKLRNSFPSVNENKWVNKFIKGGNK